MQDDLKQVINIKVESKEIEYKGPMAWGDDKKLRCELVKDILALANTKGGWLVIGMEETPAGFNPGGVTQEQAESFDTTKINQFVNNYADPPINTTLVKREFDGKLFVFISIPRFPDIPHICQKDFPGVLRACTIYIRTDNNESAPLKSSSDFRAIVETAVRNRSDQLLESISHILKHGPPKPSMPDIKLFQQEEKVVSEHFGSLIPKWAEESGIRDIVIYPKHFNAKRFELPKLREMAERASISYTGWPLIFISRMRSDVTYNVDDGIESIFLDKDLTGNANFQYWKLYQSGLLYAKEIMFEDRKFAGSGDPPFLDFLRTCQYAALAVDCLVKLYEKEIEEEENIYLKFKLTGIQNRSLGSFQPGRDIRPGRICRSKQLTFETQKTLAEWRSGIIDHAIEICNYIFLRFNWEEPNLYEARKIMEKMFSRIIE